MERQLANQNGPEEHLWMGSYELIRLLREGMRNASVDLKAKIIYGFESVLPQVAFI